MTDLSFHMKYGHEKINSIITVEISFLVSTKYLALTVDTSDFDTGT